METFFLTQKANFQFISQETHCGVPSNLLYQSIHYNVKGFLQGQMEDVTSILIMKANVYVVSNNIKHHVYVETF